jgi:hypothetical protein
MPVAGWVRSSIGFTLHVLLGLSACPSRSGSKCTSCTGSCLPPCGRDAAAVRGPPRRQARPAGAARWPSCSQPQTCENTRVMFPPMMPVTSAWLNPVRRSAAIRTWKSGLPR